MTYYLAFKVGKKPSFTVYDQDPEQVITDNAISVNKIEHADDLRDVPLGVTTAIYNKVYDKQLDHLPSKGRAAELVFPLLPKLVQQLPGGATISTKPLRVKKEKTANTQHEKKPVRKQGSIAHMLTLFKDGQWWDATTLAKAVHEKFSDRELSSLTKTAQLHLSAHFKNLYKLSIETKQVGRKKQYRCKTEE